MMDSHARQLINEALDGELPEAGRAKLDDLLASSGEARSYFEEMRELGELLEQTPALEPPAGLRSAIMAKVKLPEPQTRAGFSLAAWLRDLPQPAMLFLTFAAGALLATAVLGIATNARMATDPEQLVGTMANVGQDELPGPKTQLAIDAGAVSGLASVSLLEDVWVISFTLRSDSEVDVDLAPAGQPLRFRGFTRSDDNATLTHESAERVTVSSFGTSEFAVALDALESEAAQFRVTIRSNGQPLYSGAFGAPQ